MNRIAGVGRDKIIDGRVSEITRWACCINCRLAINIKPVEGGKKACGELIYDGVLTGSVLGLRISTCRLGKSSSHCHFHKHGYNTDNKIARFAAQPHDDITDDTQQYHHLRNSIKLGNGILVNVALWNDKPMSK